MEVLKVLKKSKLYDYAIDLLSNKYDWKNRGKEYWKKRFNKNQLDFIGYILKIDNKYVGFLGVIGSLEKIGLSVWFVKENYRKYSISFLSNSLHQLNEKSVINSSPNPTALKVFLKMKGFKLENEYIGIPKKILGFSSKTGNIYYGNKINVYFDKNVSLIDLIYLTLKKRKLTLALYNDPKTLVLKKKINVLYKNIKYNFPLSIYGDIFE